MAVFQPGWRYGPAAVAEMLRMRGGVGESRGGSDRSADGGYS
jgi:hypothetical protein